MILSFCPGGVTSNMFTKLAGGTVALSITLTAVVSLLSGLTVPTLVSWAASQFLGELNIKIDVTSITLSMFAITALPVLLGLVANSLAGEFARKTEKKVSLFALFLFVVIIFAAMATNWNLLIENLGLLGPVIVTLNVILLLLGAVVPKLVNLSQSDRLCIAIEAGVQNGAVGIALAGLVAQTGGIPEYAFTFSRLWGFDVSGVHPNYFLVETHVG